MERILSVAGGHSRRVVWLGAILVVIVGGGGGQAADQKLHLPLGLQEQAAFIPDDNPLTPEKIALGKQFYWDKRWSKSGTVACVSCHQPDHGWTDPQQFSTNFEGKPTPRRAPAIVNRLFSDNPVDGSSHLSRGSGEEG